MTLAANIILIILFAAVRCLCQCSFGAYSTIVLPIISKSNGKKSSYVNQTLEVDLVGWFSYAACGGFDPQSEGTTMTQFAIASANGTLFTAIPETWSHSIAQSTLNFTFVNIPIYPAENINIVQ
jgi:hypothetical protein